MELRQIKYFIEVAKREHMTEASTSLHVAQSAVSRQIFNLEAELGVSLFFREGRSIRLTPIGSTFLAFMEQAINVIDQGVREVQESLDPEKGTIRVGYPSSLASYMLPTVISAFRKQYPDVKFKLLQGSYHELIEEVIKGEVDIALVAPVPRGLKKIKGEVLFLDNIVALLSTDHPLAGRSAIALSDLKEDSFILFPEGFIMRDMVVDACQEAGFTPLTSFEGQDIDAIKGLVSAGLGVTLIPEITLIDSLPRSTVRVPLTGPSVSRNVGVIIPKERELMPTERIFYQFLRNFFVKLNGFTN